MTPTAVAMLGTTNNRRTRFSVLSATCAYLLISVLVLDTLHYILVTHVYCDAHQHWTHHEASATDGTDSTPRLLRSTPSQTHEEQHCLGLSRPQNVRHPAALVAEETIEVATTQGTRSARLSSLTLAVAPKTSPPCVSQPI